MWSGGGAAFHRLTATARDHARRRLAVNPSHSRTRHDSVRAALVYLHRTQGGDRKIARAMEALFPGDSAAPAGDA